MLMDLEKCVQRLEELKEELKAMKEKERQCGDETELKSLRKSIQEHNVQIKNLKNEIRLINSMNREFDTLGVDD